MEIQQARNVLKEIERHANGSRMTGMYNDASGYFKGLFFKIADEARQKKWIDEDTYALITDINSEGISDAAELTVLGCASTVFMRFLGEPQKNSQGEIHGNFHGNKNKNKWNNFHSYNMNREQPHNIDAHMDDIVSEINDIADGLREFTEKFSSSFKSELMDDIAEDITNKVINALKNLPKEN